MSKPPHRHVDDLRGATRLAIEATRGVTALVEEMHNTIGGGPAWLGRPLAAPTKAITGLVYGGVSATTAVVGAGLDGALARLTPLVGEGVPGPERDAVVAALNGVLGDYLEATDNPLAISMTFRREGQSLDLSALREAVPAAQPRLLLRIHGSSMNDRQWLRDGQDHGAALAEARHATLVDVHYNSGLHISHNGAELAQRLEALVQAWPEAIDEIVVLTHSMGGLVARSAHHYAQAQGCSWPSRLAAMAFLGTPHHGAPLERLGNLVDRGLGISRYSAPFARLGKIRSAGVTDLRHGLLVDEDWQGRDRFAAAEAPRTVVPLPEGVSCYAVAGVAKGLAGRVAGDGLVPVESALGRDPAPERDLGFPEEHVRVVANTTHLDLLSSAEVHEALQGWLGRSDGAEVT